MLPSFRSLLATASLLACRRLSAWARPLPSARASEKVENSTVNQSQMVI